MERCFAVFMMAVVFIYPAVAMAKSEWEICLEQSQNFRQLPEVDGEFGPLLTLAERVRKLPDLVIFIPESEQLSPEERQLARALFRRDSRVAALIQNCNIWSALGDLIVIVRTIATNPEKWRTFLEERKQKDPSRLPIHNDPEQLLQQATALRQRLEHFDPTQLYHKQMDPFELKWFEELRREVSSIAGRVEPK